MVDVENIIINENSERYRKYKNELKFMSDERIKEEWDNVTKFVNKDKNDHYKREEEHVRYRDNHSVVFK